MIDEKNFSLRAGNIIDGKWVILEAIGKGGMGEVYLAHQLNLNRRVAIKIISREWKSSFREDREALDFSLERFRREMQVMAQVRHPNIIQIQDYGIFTPTNGDTEG